MEASRSALEGPRASLAEILKRLVAVEGDHPNTLSGVQLVRGDKPALVACHILVPTLAVVVQGEMAVEVGREKLNFGETASLLTPLHLPAMMQITKATPRRPFLGVIVLLDMDAAREIVMDGFVAPPRGSDSGPAVTSILMSEQLLDAVVRLVRLNDHPEDIPMIGKLLQREILYRLLTSSYAGVMRQIATIGSQHHRVARAVDWLRVNFREPLHVEDLAERAHMAVSTLHQHFREMTGSSPLQFQKQLRLFEARRMMLVDGVDAASAAFATGYESATQFNREYRRQFGQPPRRDIRALKGVSGLAPITS